MKMGLTLVEVMVALVLAGLLALVGTRVLQQPAVLVTRTEQRLEEDQLAGLSLRELANNLGASHPHATGFVVCEGQSIPYPLSLMVGQTLKLEKPGDKFSFAYSASSGLVALDRTYKNKLYLSDSRAVRAGELVMLSHLNNSKIGGIFLVTSVDPTSRSVTLKDGGFEVPDQIPCNKSASSTSIEGLFGDASPSIFNEKATTYRLDVIRFVSYEMQQEKTDRFPKIFKYEWPVGSGAIVEGADPVEENAESAKALSTLRSTLDLMSVQSMVLRLAEESELGGGESVGSNGTSANFAVEVVRFEKTAGGVERERKYKAYSRFLLDSSERLNFAAPTLPPTAELKYPTCGVSAAPVNGIFQVPNASAFPNLYLVSGFVSSTGGVPPLLMVQAQVGSTGGSPKCWKLSTDGTLDRAGSPYDSDPSILGPFQVKGTGASQLALGISSAGSYDSALCDMSEGGSLNVSMLYWDQGVGRNLRKNCTGLEEIAAFKDQPYSFKGPKKNTCSNIDMGDVKIPKIEFGQIVKKSDGTLGPSFFISKESCCWEKDSPPKTKSSPLCSGGTFAGSCEFSPEKGSLKGVWFYPSPPDDIKIDDPSYGAGFVACSP